VCTYIQEVLKRLFSSYVISFRTAIYHHRIAGELKEICENSKEFLSRLAKLVS
jgi:hypothetical protein